MILYNVTIKVDWSIHNEWLSWMKEIHVPGVLATGFFNESRLVRLLQVDESDGPTYAVQYYSDSLDHYNLYVESHLAVHDRNACNKWGDKFVSFSTIMEVVQ